MIIIKYISIILLITLSTLVGIIYSKKYTNRVRDLDEMENALNMFRAKIRLTYEPIPEVFKEISVQLNQNIGNIFIDASKNMNKMNAKEAWEYTIEQRKNGTSFTKNDLNIIKGLSKLLGNVDLEGQINEIELTSELLKKQIEEAQIEKKKNTKLYKTLGSGLGLAIAIILM